MAKRTQKIENPFVDVQAGAKATATEISTLQGVVDALNTSLTAVRTKATELKTTLGDKSGGNLVQMQNVNSVMSQAIDLHKQETTIIKGKTIVEKQLVLSKKEQQSAEQSLQRQREKGIALMEKERLKQEQLTKKIEQQGQAYNRVNGWLNKLSQEHRNLAIRQELGIKLTTEEAKRMQVLEGRITRYDTALKNVDATQGKFGRTVGNYKSGWNGLGNSINQLTREMPAFANSMQTGFMAISNNLPMFFDEISRVRMANEELVAQGLKTESVFKQIGRSLISTSSILSVGVTLLTFYGPALADFVSSLFSATEAEKEQAKAIENSNKQRQRGLQRQKEFNGNLADETDGLIASLYALRNTNKDSKIRHNLIKDINEQYGTTLKNMSSELEFQQQINLAVQDYIAFKFNALKLQQNEKYFNYHLEKKYELEKKSHELEKQLLVFQRKKGDYFEGRIYEENETIKAIAERMRIEGDEYLLTQSQIDQNELQLNRLGLTREQLLVVGEQWRHMYENTNKSTKALEANNTQMDENNVTLSDYIENLKRLDAIVKELGEIEIDFRIKILDETILAENENIRRKILAGEEYSRDAINKMYNERFDLQSRLLENEYSFKVKLAQESFNDEKRIAKEGLIEQKNKLIEDINESEWGAERKANDRLSVEKNYQIEVEKLELLFKERQKTIDAEKIKDKVDFESKVYDLSKQTKEATNKLNEDINQFEKDRLDGRISEIDDYYKDEKLKLLESKKTKEQISEEELINKRAELEEKIWILEQEGKETTDLKIQLAELNRSLNEKKLADEKKYYDEILKIGKKSADELLEYQIKKSQERQKILDGNISASEKESDILAQKASQGNLLAEESLKKQQEITNKYRDQRRQEEEKEQALQQAKKYVEIALNITNSLIQKGGDPITSAGKSIGLVSVIKGLFGKGFFFGTDDTGSDSPVKDSYGKITGFTHENEQVWSKQDRADVGFASRKELKNAWDFMHSPNMIMPKISPQTDITHAPILREQLRKLDQMNNKLDKIPSEFFSTEVIQGVLTAVHVKQDGNTTTKRYIGS